MKDLLEKYKPEGLRVIVSYNCKRNCSFCYQNKKDSVILTPEKFESILYQLSEYQFIPIYFTFQGGEISDYSDISYELFKIADKFYPQVFRKSITSNGHGDIDFYKKSKLYGITHITLSLHNNTSKNVERLFDELKYDNFYTKRVNCFFTESEVNNVKYVYNYCKDNQIPLTLCEDLRFIELDIEIGRAHV